MQPNQPFTPWVWRGRDPGWIDDARAAGIHIATDLNGYAVEATDGSIGTVEDASYAEDRGFVVVDTGPWIFGHRVLIPAGVIQHVDTNERKVYADRTRQQIKDAPAFDQDQQSPDYLDRVGAYYADTYGPQPQDH